MLGILTTKARRRERRRKENGSFCLLRGFVPSWFTLSVIALFFLAGAGRLVRAAEAPFENEIRAFQEADRTQPPPKDAVLFLGSSSIRLWETLTKDFPAESVIRRGFGGSQIADSVRYADQIVIPYHPRQIVFYAGDNDIAAGRSPHQVLRDYQAFVKKVRASLPDVRISFIAIKPSLARWKLVDQIAEANRLIEEFSRKEKNLDFIDVFAPMLGNDGKPRADLLRPDGLHLNAKGYALWASLISPYLRRGSAELRLHFAKGDVHRIRVVLEQSINQTVQEIVQNTKQTVSVIYSMRVEDINEKGAGTVAVRYDAVVFHADTPAGAVDYDSAKPPAQTPLMAAGLAAMVGQKFTMTLSAAGQVLEVQGLDKLAEAIIAKLNLPAGPAKNAAEKVLRQQISPQNLRSNVENLFFPLPGGPVAPGESWSRKTTVSLGFPMEVQTTYTLKSRDGAVAVIDARGSSSTTPDASLDLGPQMKMTYDLVGEQSGTIKLDEKSGWVAGARVDQKLSGTATIRAEKTLPQAIPISVTTKMVMQPVER